MLNLTELRRRLEYPKGFFSEQERKQLIDIVEAAKRSDRQRKILNQVDRDTSPLNVYLVECHRLKECEIMTEKLLEDVEMGDEPENAL